jgi:hypothetical protein
MNSDAMALQAKLQGAVNKMMDNVDAKYLRSMQKETYLKMAGCFDKHSTSQSLQNCLQTQDILMKSVQQMIQNEMNQFQERLQRCSMGCQDEVNDKFSLTSDSSQNEIAKAEQHILKCSGVCIDKHIALLGPLEKNIVSKIHDIKKQAN